jgi:hypothetical protein
MDDPRDIIGHGIVRAVEGSGIATMIAKMDPTTAALLSNAVERAADYIPSPEGCGCAAKKRAMVEQMKVWLLEAQARRDAQQASQERGPDVVAVPEV